MERRGLLDIARTPEGLGLLFAGVGSAMSGDPRPLNTNIALQAAFDDLQMQRQAVKERARRKEALARLPQLLGQMGPDGTMADPAARGEVLGLLSEVSPDTVVGGLLGEMFPKRSEGRADPTEIRTMQMLGIPLTEENYARFKQMGGGAGGLDALQQAQLAKILMELQTASGDRAKAADEEGKKRRTSEVTINRNLSDIEHALELVDKTEGTFLETGIPFGDARRGILSGSAAALSAFGMDKPGMQETLDAYDELGKTLNKLVVSRDNANLGTLTDAKLSLVQGAMGSTKISPQALRSILLDTAEGMLDEADIQGYKVNGLDTYRENFGVRRKQKGKAPNVVFDVPKAVDRAEAAGGSLADRAASFAGDAAAAARGVADQVVVRAADIARMGLEELQKLDVDKLTDEQARALDARLRALGK